MHTNKIFQNNSSQNYITHQSKPIQIPSTCTCTNIIFNMHILHAQTTFGLHHITDYIVNHHITPHSVSLLIHMKVYICGAIIVSIYNRCAQIIMPVEQTIHNILTYGARKSSVIKTHITHPHVLHSSEAHTFTKYTHVEFTPTRLILYRHSYPYHLSQF